MQRVSIIGCCGSGKSTLSHTLNKITGLPVVHLDKEFWNPGWTPSNPAEFKDRMASIYRRDSWIIDGHYFSTLADRLRYSDTVYHLDYPTHICLYRAVKRIFTTYGKVRLDCAEGCPEKFDLGFILYLLKFRKTFHKKTLNLLAKYPHLDVHTFKHPAELQAHINRLS